MMNRPVPHRRGWTFGQPVSEGTEVRVAVYHRKAARGFWIHESVPERQDEAAQRGIDRIYAAAVAAMAEVIEDGDRRGPNVRRIESTGAGHADA